MKSITKAKAYEEVSHMLEGIDRVFLVGCGTCTTMTHTGGVPEVRAMTERLQETGKIVTGSTVVPVACDDMTSPTLQENQGQIRHAGALLVLTCALGVQRVSSLVSVPVIPALDTLFIGLELEPGNFAEACDQCGECVIGWTGGICPITACHKRLVNGPCGGTHNGKCEVSPEKDCAWTLIYNRLKTLNRLDLMRQYQPIKNAQVEIRPRRILITPSTEVEHEQDV